MADAKRQRALLSICEAAIPSTAPFGTVYVAKDSGAVYYATKSEVVVNLIDVLHAEQPHAVPVNGRDGKDGADGAKGERGPVGRDGKDGTNGRDGRDGERGPQGFDGRPGECKCRCKTEIAEARLSQVTDANAALRTELEAQVAELKFIVQALLDADKKGKEYIAYLRAKNQQSKES